MNDNYLMHYGVKGMRWGVRRGRNASSASPRKPRPKKELTPDQKKRAQRNQDLKNRRTLSDKELKHKIERMKMEKQLKELTNEDIHPGRTMVKDIMVSSGKKALSSAAAGAMVYGIKVAMTKKVDPIEAAKYIAPLPKKK